MGPHCLSLRLLKRFSRREKQTSFVTIGVLRFKTVLLTMNMAVIGGEK